MQPLTPPAHQTTPLSNGSVATRDMMAIGVIAFVLHALLLLFVAAHHPQYLADYRLTDNPDARHYVLLGRNFWLLGVYSRQLVPPYLPDVLRTPIYPLLAGGIDALFGSIWPLYFVQGLLVAATALVVYRLGVRFAGRSVGLLAGCLLAVDLTLQVLSLQAMSEILYLVFATLAVAVWVGSDGPWKSERALACRPLLTGILLGLAVLVRPAGLYLPLVLAAVEVPGLVGRFDRRLVARVGVMLAVAYVAILPWMIRNYRLYGILKSSTADTINLVYFAAAGAYQVEYRLTGEAGTRQRIADEYQLPTLVMSNNFWRANESVASMDQRQRRAALKILAEHPKQALKATLIGLNKSFVSHNVGELAQASGMRWNAPGLGRLIHGEFVEARRELNQNHPMLRAVFVWEVFFAVATLLGAALGAALALWSPAHRQMAFRFLGCTAYGALTVAVVGIDAYSRHRTPMLPFLCIFAGYSLARASQRFGPATWSMGVDHDVPGA